MKHVLKFAIVAGLWSMAGCATKQPTPPEPPKVTSHESVAPDRVARTNTVTARAVVTDIDQEKRLVTLLGSDGQEQTIQVSDEVRNLPQVKKGDEVLVQYYESVVFQLHEKGKATPGSGVAETGSRANPGEMPSAMGARSVNVTATVMKIDKTAPSVTLKNADGKMFTLPVKEASRLDAVKVGDLIEITYSQALAISVERAGK